MLITSPETTILVDMDGVLGDFEEACNAIVRADFPHIPIITERQEFYFAPTYEAHEGVGERIHTAIREPGFFQGLPLVDGAIEGFAEIIETRFTPQICSSPIEDHEPCVTEKIDWLEEHFVPVFGAWVVDAAIFDRDKSGYTAAALIDDSPHVRNLERAVWQHIIFDRSYNRSVETELRLLGWRDSNLSALLRAAQQKYAV